MAQGRKTGGRQSGTPNKLSKALKDMILQALDEAHPKGAVEYLKGQAATNPTAFLTLVGKVMPLQVEGGGEGSAPISFTLIRQPDGG